MRDDHAVPALCAYDSRLISTANLDRLADEGALRFVVRDELDLRSQPGCDLDRQARKARIASTSSPRNQKPRL